MDVVDNVDGLFDKLVNIMSKKKETNHTIFSCLSTHYIR